MGIKREVYEQKRDLLVKVVELDGAVGNTEIPYSQGREIQNRRKELLRKYMFLKGVCNAIEKEVRTYGL